MDNYEDFALKVGNNIKSLRKKRGLSQQKLAEFLHTTQPNISAVERGERLTLPFLFEIAQFFGVTIYDFFYSHFESKTVEDFFPIQKLKGRTYYCYYIKRKEIVYFQIKIVSLLNPYQATAKIKFQNSKSWIDNFTIEITANSYVSNKIQLELDNKFATLILRDRRVNKHIFLSFNYFHDSSSNEYLGGIAMFCTVNSIREVPQMKLCAISHCAISEKKYGELKQFLNISAMTNNLSQSKYSIDIDPSIEQKFFLWIKNM